VSIEEQLTNDAPDFGKKPEQPRQPRQPNILGILGKKRLKKNLQEYQEHPLNFDRNLSTGKILRGIEGLVGSLDLAILDIFSGVAEKVTGKTPDEGLDKKRLSDVDGIVDEKKLEIKQH